jgi:hypothetical protein
VKHTRLLADSLEAHDRLPRGSFTLRFRLVCAGGCALLPRLPFAWQLRIFKCVATAGGLLLLYVWLLLML